jgi:hypothetical protein
MYKGICLLALLAIASVAVAIAQNTEIKIEALDGKSGKPLANQRLVIFGGESAEAATFHHTAFDVTTDERALADLKFDPAKTRWIQVWTDGMTLCQSKPNVRSFSVDTILTTGLSAPNTCGSLVHVATPGHFTVFARPASLREKMSR